MKKVLPLFLTKR